MITEDKILDFQVTGTLVWYYYICKREVWLMSHQLFPDEDNENILIGRIIGENSYPRDKKEIDLGNAKIDLIKTENGDLVIGEVKKSSRFIDSASRQLLFYLLQLKDIGINARGELLIPEEKKKIEVLLDEIAEAEIRTAINNIENIVSKDLAPEPVKNKYCKNCAYSEFCWA
ncbi:MAG: CRISPR-associated protein Cas4 [Syntrophomonadaceae bacterium]|nr:CRISPR-associated protein Cas4 [Syntrophomonadaceae bacterium]